MSFSRDNALDQQLDIAGSLNQTDDLTTLTDESSCFGQALTGQSGAAASITVTAVVTVTGLSGMTAGSVGNFLTLTGAATGANNGTFLISVFNSPTSVEIINASAATDGNNGSISWTERQPYSLEDDLNYTRSDRALIKGVDYDADIPTYFRCTDQSVAVPANLSNVAGKTLDAKSFVTNRLSPDESVSVGDGYITISGSFGTFPYADAIDVTGVPIFDGFDAGNDESVYVELIADGYTDGMSVLGGPNAGDRIFGRARQGTSGVDGYSVEIEFRSVTIGDDISTSSAYTWEAGQSPIIDVYYPFRDCLDTMDENAFRTTLVNGLIGDAKLRQDTINLQMTIGVGDGDTDLSGRLTNLVDFFPFSDLPDGTPTVVEALNTLNEQIGDRTYTGSIIGDNDGYTITETLQNLADAIGVSSAVVRTIERLTSEISAGTPHTLPGGLSYTLDGTDNGRNMWVFWRGVLRDPGIVSDGNDYEETDTTTITPYRKVRDGDHINYFILS